MRDRFERLKERWYALKETSGFKNSMLFLVFVAVSTLFWFILALNDSAQNHFNVRVNVSNMPDSVTFISDFPDRIHVTVNDKGTNLWRNGFLKTPTINIDFKEYASDGVLHYSYSDLISALKETFGGSAQITALSLDSIQLVYTTNPGKRVPVMVNCQVYPASGTTLEGNIKSSPASVYVYGPKDVTDTIHSVHTEMLTLRDINETTTTEARIRKIKGARVLPSSVSLTVPVEPLVRKEAMVSVMAVNVPEKEEMLLFPSKVPVEYYVAMSRLNDDEDNNITLQVDYNEIGSSGSSKLFVHTVSFPDRLKNLRLQTDSVEYAIIHD
ncbi:MAG: hypothetical protein J1E78_07425 [Muribaculaceae bacterium]|nr:hypothetical protein [Muribaculaceae bacterium]